MQVSGFAFFGDVKFVIILWITDTQPIVKILITRISIYLYILKNRPCGNMGIKELVTSVGVIIKLLILENTA